MEVVGAAAFPVVEDHGGPRRRGQRHVEVAAVGVSDVGGDADAAQGLVEAAHGDDARDTPAVAVGDREAARAGAGGVGAVVGDRRELAAAGVVAAAGPVAGRGAAHVARGVEVGAGDRVRIADLVAGDRAVAADGRRQLAGARVVAGAARVAARRAAHVGAVDGAAGQDVPVADLALVEHAVAAGRGAEAARDVEGAVGGATEGAAAEAEVAAGGAGQVGGLALLGACDDAVAAGSVGGRRHLHGGAVDGAVEADHRSGVDADDGVARHQVPVEVEGGGVGGEAIDRHQHAVVDDQRVGVGVVDPRPAAPAAPLVGEGHRDPDDVPLAAVGPRSVAVGLGRGVELSDLLGVRAEVGVRVADQDRVLVQHLGEHVDVGRALLGDRLHEDGLVTADVVPVDRLDLDLGEVVVPKHAVRGPAGAEAVRHEVAAFGRQERGVDVFVPGLAEGHRHHVVVGAGAVVLHVHDGALAVHVDVPGAVVAGPDRVHARRDLPADARRIDARGQQDVLGGGVHPVLVRLEEDRRRPGGEHLGDELGEVGPPLGAAVVLGAEDHAGGLAVLGLRVHVTGGRPRDLQGDRPPRGAAQLLFGLVRGQRLAAGEIGDGSRGRRHGVAPVDLGPRLGVVRRGGLAVHGERLAAGDTGRGRHEEGEEEKAKKERSTEHGWPLGAHVGAPPTGSAAGSYHQMSGRAPERSSPFAASEEVPPSVVAPWTSPRGSAAQMAFTCRRSVPQQPPKTRRAGRCASAAR